MPKKFEDVIEIPKFLYPAKRGRPSKQELLNRAPHPVYRAPPKSPSNSNNNLTQESRVDNSNTEMAKRNSKKKSSKKAIKVEIPNQELNLDSRVISSIVQPENTVQNQVNDNLVNVDHPYASNSQINDNEIINPEISSSSIPDNLINFSPTEDNPENPQKNNLLSTTEVIKSENITIENNEKNDEELNDSESLHSSWSGKSNLLSQLDVFNLYVVPHVNSDDISAIKDGIQSLQNWHKNETLRLTLKAGEENSTIDLKAELNKRGKQFKSWLDSLQYSLSNAEAQKIEKSLLKDLKSFVNFTENSSGIQSDTPIPITHSTPFEPLDSEFYKNLGIDFSTFLNQSTVEETSEPSVKPKIRPNILSSEIPTQPILQTFSTIPSTETRKTFANLTETKESQTDSLNNPYSNELIKDLEDQIECLQTSDKQLRAINLNMAAENVLLRNLSDTEIRDENKSLSNANKVLHQALDEKIEIISSQHSEMQRLIEDNDALKKSLNKATSVLQVAKDRLADAQTFNNTNNNLKTEIENLRQTLTKENSTLKKNIESLNNSLTKETSNNKILTDKLVKYNSKINDLIKKNEDLFKFNESLSPQEYRVLEEKLKETEGHLSHLQLEYKHLVDINKSLTIEIERGGAKSPIFTPKSRSFASTIDDQNVSDEETLPSKSNNVIKTTKVKTFSNDKHSNKVILSNSSNNNTSHPEENNSHIPPNNNTSNENQNQNLMIQILQKLTDNATAVPSPQQYNHSVICKLEPTEFDGTIAEAEDWLRDFNMRAANNNWSDQHKYRCAKAKMKGSAKEWCLLTFQDHNDPSLSLYTSEVEPSWQEFCEKFLAHFRPAGSEYVLEDQLKTLRKTDSETYTEFAIRFLTFARQANANMPEAKIIFLLKKALEKDPILNSVTHITSIEQIRAALRSVDDIHFSDRILRKNSTQRPEIESGNNNRSSENQILEPKNTQKNRRKWNVSAPELMKCFNCGKNGHRKSECKEPENQKLVEEWQKYVKATRAGDYSLPRPKTSAAITLRNTHKNSSNCELGTRDPNYFEYAESDLEDTPEPKPSSTILLSSSNTSELLSNQKSNLPIEIDVKVNGLNFEAMIDTGSALSCISEEAFQCLNPKPLTTGWPQEIKVISVNETSVTPEFITEPLKIPD